MKDYKIREFKWEKDHIKFKMDFYVNNVLTNVLGVPAEYFNHDSSTFREKEGERVRKYFESKIKHYR